MTAHRDSSRRKRKRARGCCAPRWRRLFVEQFEARTMLSSAPDGSDKQVTTLEDTAYVVQPSDFGFTDSNDSPPDLFVNVKITTLPMVGALTDGNAAVVAGQFIPFADIVAGRLQFVPIANANGLAYASFTFQVQDTGLTSNLDPTPNTITINVTPVNDPPSGANKNLVLGSGCGQVTTYRFTASDFCYSDPNDNPSNHLAAIDLVGLSGLGALTDKGARGRGTGAGGRGPGVKYRSGGRRSDCVVGDGCGFAAETAAVRECRVGGRARVKYRRIDFRLAGIDTRALLSSP